MNVESVSHVYLKFVVIFHQIMMRWRKKFTEQIRVKKFLQKLKKWESGGFITSDVWSEIGNIVDSNAVASALSAITQDDNDDEKMCSEDPSDDRLFSCVARYVLDSRALHFTIEMLGWPVHSYQVQEDANPNEKHLMKFRVCHAKQHLIQVI